MFWEILFLSFWPLWSEKSSCSAVGIRPLLDWKPPDAPLCLLLFSHSIVSNSLQPHGLQHSRLLCPLPSPRVHSNSRPLSQWCHLTISSSVITFSFCLQSLPASGSFPMSRLFTSRGQNIGASASVFPMNIQGWFILGLIGLISLQSKELSRVFSKIWKHQLFSTKLSLGPAVTSIHDYWKNHSFD